MSFPPMDQPLDDTAPEARKFLQTLQAGILKPHGRSHARLIFAEIRQGMAETARSEIARLANTKLGSAADQLDRANAYRANHASDGGTVWQIGLSASGYRALGIPPQRQPQDPKNAGANSFTIGMAQDKLGDPPQQQWEDGYQQPLHVIVLAADDDEKRLAAEVGELLGLLESFARVHVVETGRELTRQQQGRAQVIEHFGFADGVSQPLFTKSEIARDVEARGDKQWKSAGPLNLVLAPDFCSAGSFGSFLVYRKLEQNVAKFQESVETVANAIDPANPDLDYAAALMVGRYRDGRPLIPTPPPGAGLVANDFNYDGDTHGEVCPFHTHIRKTNPRGDLSRREGALVPLEAERMLRIARRAISYGKRPDLEPGAKLPLPSSGVGLLFMCCQASLRGFFLQQEGAVADNFVEDGVGTDPVIGPKSGLPQHWAPGVTWGFGDHVTMKGGEYFFLPGLSFLRNLNN
jgi:deferrochelatase/peroxidase EfeB